MKQNLLAAAAALLLGVGCSAPAPSPVSENAPTAVETVPGQVYASFSFDSASKSGSTYSARGEFDYDFTGTGIRSITYQTDSDDIQFVEVVPIRIEQAHDTAYLTENGFVEASYGTNDQAAADSACAVAIRPVGSRYTAVAADPSTHHFAVNVFHTRNRDFEWFIDSPILHATVEYADGAVTRQSIVLGGSFNRGKITAEPMLESDSR